MAIDKNLEKLSRLLNVLDEDALTKEDFLKHFEMLLDIVKKVKDELSKNIDAKTQDAVRELESLQSTYKETIKKIEDENTWSLSNVKRLALDNVNNFLVKSQLKEKLEEVEEKLEELREVETPDLEDIVEESSRLTTEKMKELLPVVPVLEEELPKLGEPIRDALELLQGEDRLASTAIRGLDEELRRLRTAGAVYTGGGNHNGIFLNQIIAQAGLHVYDDQNLIFGTGNSSTTSAIMQYDTAETVDTLKIGISETSRRLILCDYGDISGNSALAAATNPTLTIFSATSIASSTQYVSITHNATNAVITAGTGAVNIVSGSGDGVNVLSTATLQLVGAASSQFIFANSADSIGIALRPHITTTTSVAAFTVLNDPFGTSFSASSSTQTLVSFQGTVNQSSTAAFVGLDHNYTLTSVGSGTSYFERFRVGGTSRLDILITGKIVGASTDASSVDFQTATDHSILLSGSGFLYFRSTSVYMRENSGLEVVENGNAKGMWMNGTTRLQPKQGSDVASANDLTLGAGNTFEITGTTQINAITTTNWQTGVPVYLIFAGVLTVKHNTAGGANTAVILLKSGADLTTAAGTTLALVYSEQGGTNAWREV